MTYPPFRRPRFAATLAALLVCLAAPAGAQVVRGTAVDSASGQPLPDATVRLLDAKGKPVAGALVDRGGNFVIRAPAGGRYRVRLQRIGHRMALSPWITVPARGAVTVRIAAESAPITLTTVEVLGRARCVVNPRQSRQVSLLWNEARKALEAEMLTRDTRAVWVEVEDRVRDLDPQTLAPRGERSARRDGVALQAYQAPEPAQLAERGFVQELGGETRFHAPDAAVLLSESFERTHCFLAVVDSARPDLIGLGFQPDPESEVRVPDVSGTLWLDRATAELRFLEYRYERLPMRLPVEGVGGRVEYRRLPAGRWIVQRWESRTPVFEHLVGARRPAPANGGGNGNGGSHAPYRPAGRRLVAVREASGEVVAASLVGAEVWAAGRRALQATVVQGGSPVGGVRVALEGTPFTGTSDRAGRLAIADVPPGVYDVTVTLPGPSPLELPRVTSVEVSRTQTARIVVPTLDSIAELLCPGSRPAGTTVLTGTVRARGDGSPLRDAMLTIRWRRLTSANAAEVVGREEGLDVRTDGAGRYVACGVPADTRLVALVPVAGGGAPARVELDGGSGPLVTMDIRAGAR